jgi:hypothetical protein
MAGRQGSFREVTVGHGQMIDRTLAEARLNDREASGRHKQKTGL